jgi:hypothetical protein
VSRFRIETELTIHALEVKMPLAEMKTTYRDRGEGSTSKLSTYKDGARILLVIVNLIKQERPLLLFFILSAVLFVVAVVLGVPLMVEFRTPAHGETTL